MVPAGSSGELLAHMEASVILFVSDPDSPAPTSAEALCRLYALTPSEARLACGLMQGRTLSELAEQAHLTVNSARWVVKQILHKTDTRTQAQAVALMLHSLAVLHRSRVDASKLVTHPAGARGGRRP